MFVTFRYLGHVGRLGNQLFQIAAVIGVATKNELEYVFPVWDYAGWFEREIPQASVIAPTRTCTEKTFAYQDIVIREPTNLLGYFQTEKYFAHCKDLIRFYFEPHATLRQQLMAKHAKVLSRKTCSVHVRRADYVADPYFPDLTATDYYQRAFEQFDDDTTLVFFSDDMSWVKDHFRGDRFVYIEGNRAIEDLFLISLCKSHIIANSSFSWWGAWLNPNEDKKVVAPKQWFCGEYIDPNIPFRVGPRYHGFHDTKDLLPESWIRL